VYPKILAFIKFVICDIVQTPWCGLYSNIQRHVAAVVGRILGYPHQAADGIRQVLPGLSDGGVRGSPDGNGSVIARIEKG
jgi:hypothetical protein